MADIHFPSKDTNASTSHTELSLPIESLDLAATDIAARTGSTHVLEEILSRGYDHSGERRTQ